MTDQGLGGLLVVDKPVGWTSHDVIARARGLTGIRQIGHSGTLDPMASGVLLLCVGQATRLLEYLAGQPKTYRASITFGVATDTYDATGQTTSERPAPELSAAMLEPILANFRGEILQMPPAYSAIKRDGVPSYKRARRGEEVILEPRPVVIYDLAVLGCDGSTVEVQLRCSAGTYVRSLAHDLGERLGCGAHLSSLRRLAVGSFDVGQAVTLQLLAERDWRRWLLPPETAVAHLPRLDLAADQVTRLGHGQAIAASPPCQPGPAGAFDPAGRLVAIVELDKTRQFHKPIKVFATQDE